MLVVVGDLAGFFAVGDDLGRNQHDQLGARATVVGGTEQPSQHRNAIETGDTGITDDVLFLDQATEQDGLTTLNGDLRAHFALRNGRVRLGCGDRAS